jgi:membrane peptidoglycan carboxypeptidase
MEGGRTRGASTITQQLIKHLFFGTSRSFLRNGAEFTLVPVAEFVLGKRRILEISLNVVEWGPGIYGAESACHYYDGTAAQNIGRQQAARLAAILPAPPKRRPERMNNYSGAHSRAAAPNGLVIVSNILPMRRILLLSRPGRQMNELVVSHSLPQDLARSVARRNRA